MSSWLLLCVWWQGGPRGATKTNPKTLLSPSDRLCLDPKEHPMMLAEPTPHPDAARERTVELMFEKHAPPALFLARDAVLASFATGRQSAIVVDAGHDSTTGEREFCGGGVGALFIFYTALHPRGAPRRFGILPPPR